MAAAEAFYISAEVFDAIKATAVENATEGFVKLAGRVRAKLG